MPKRLGQRQQSVYQQLYISLSTQLISDTHDMSTDKSGSRGSWPTEIN